MSNKKLRKLMIVIEETGQQVPDLPGKPGSGGKGFNVYLAGDKERIGKVPDDQLGTAEYWGSRLFSIVMSVLRQTGAVRTETPMPKDDEKN